MTIKQKILIYTLILLTAGAIIYLRTLNYPFQFDDDIHITNNHSIDHFEQYKDLNFWKNHIRRPLARFTFSVSNIWAEGNPAGHRIVNIILHFLNAVLVFFLFRKIFQILEPEENKERQLLLSLLVSGVFLVHPMQTQSVVYVVQRMNLLSAFFTLGALILFLSGRIRIRNQQKPALSILFFSLSAIMAVAGVLSKQNAAVILLLGFLAEAFLFHPVRKHERFVHWSTLIAIPVIIGVYFYLSGFDGTTNEVSPMEYFISQWPILLEYLKMFFAPFGQSIDHLKVPFSFPFSVGYILAGAVHITIILLAIFLKRVPSVIRFGILWFYMSHGIESGFIPITDLMVDHRNYLPYAGLTLSLGAALFHYIQNRNLRLITAIGIVFFFSIISFNRVKDWESVESIWADCIEKDPENQRGWNNLSYGLLKTNPTEAKLAALKAIKLDSTYYQAYNNLGAALLLMNDTSEAQWCFNKSLEYGPENNFIAQFNLGNTYVSRDVGKAIDYYEKTLGMDPYHHDARKQLASCYALSQKYSKAIEQYQILLKFFPNNIELVLNLAVSYDNANMTDQAISTLKHYKDVGSTHPEIYYYLANFYGKKMDYTSAEEMINLAIGIDNNLNYRLKRGFIREKQNNYKGALEDYQYVISYQYSESLEKRIEICLFEMQK
jgi:tetratricopeptide (TPR) repeat protein